MPRLAAMLGALKILFLLTEPPLEVENLAMVLEPLIWSAWNQEHFDPTFISQTAISTCTVQTLPQNLLLLYSGHTKMLCGHTVQFVMHAQIHYMTMKMSRISKLKILEEQYIRKRKASVVTNMVAIANFENFGKNIEPKTKSLYEYCNRRLKRYI